MEAEAVEPVRVKGENNHVGGNAKRRRAEKRNASQSSRADVDREQHDEEDGGGGSPSPHVGMEFDSEEVAKRYYDAYAKHNGFNTRVGQFMRSKPDGPIVTWDFTCGREVFRRKNTENCNAMLRVERSEMGKWVVTKFVKDHNHSDSSSNNVHHLRPRRHFAGTVKNANERHDSVSNPYVSTDGNHVALETNAVASVSPTELNENVTQLVEPNHPIRTMTHTVKPCHLVRNSVNAPINYVRPPSRKRNLGRDAQNLLNYFTKMQSENPGFYYAIQLDDENRMTNVFWADARSRMAYKHFGDAVTFDTMYRPNQYHVPFAPFTGINHHGQMILFGCALVLDESESSFVWLFRTFLTAMNDQPPVSLTTDQDRAIQIAVSQVLPNTRHCICKWHILREGQERLAHVYLSCPSFCGELYSCIMYSETIEDFESSWESILDNYDLQKNEWLQAVYNARKQWAPVYFRDTFFAALSSNQGMNSFFDGYVNQQTTLPMFFKQYERALEHSLEKELDADYDTSCTTPMLKTPSPMEQLASNFYTKKVFVKFQEELVETFAYTANKIDGDDVVSTFRVAKYEENHKANMVTLDFSEIIKASCSCQMFEYCGILCRHILTVFTVTNVLTLPSHYMLGRWSQNAKSWSRLEEKNDDLPGIESITLRFNTLCREAIKYAEEGAVASETYDAAISALRDGIKRVAALKKTIAKVKPFISQGNNQEDTNKKVSASVPEMVPSLWPWQDVASPCYNLNDLGPSVTEINQPSMAPVSIHRDGGPSANTVVTTCFKSMTWLLENKNPTPAGKVALINMKLQEFGKGPLGESQVQFRLTKVTLEPMLRSMLHISQQLAIPANRVAVINLKLQDTKTTTGETEVKFQVSRETLDSMLRSMAYIRDQL